MAELIDLAYTKAELKAMQKDYESRPIPSDDPYPWGLCITLDGSALDKLGMKALPGVGDEWHMTVIAKVTSVNRSASVGQDDDRRVGLQMASIDLNESAASEKGERETPASEMRESRKARS